MFRSKSLITINEPKSMATECYRMLKTNLEYMNLDKVMQVILITSSFTEEGKTTTAVNMATTYAQSGKKVLLMDCDLRKSRVHHLLGIGQSPGITDYMVDSKSLESVVQPIDEIPGFHILTSGSHPPNPVDMLESNKMKKLLSWAKSKYDVIIIDSPPVLSVTDASVLSKQVDGVVMVVGAYVTKKEELKRAKKILEMVNANILGAIMTKAEVKNKKYYAYYGDEKPAPVTPLKKISSYFKKASL